MSSPDVIESTALEVRENTLALVPTVRAPDLVERLGVIEDAMRTAMKVDVDYGHIPGTDKPALLKPGAEKLGVLFQLDVQLENEKIWGPGDHLTVMSQATVYHAPTGSRLGFGEGLCSTREKKYAYRKQERTCPTCGAAAVIKGKAEYGGGWLCWKKRDGCGAKFPEGSAAIESQPVGDVDNADLPDLWNTVVKMAEKRARVDAVLAVTGASALFTQDAADEPRADEPPPLTVVDQTDFQAPPQPPKKLTDVQRAKVLAAIRESGEKVELVLAAVGVSVPEDMTVKDAHTIRELLDGLASKLTSDIPADLPEPVNDETLDEILEEVFGEVQEVVEP